MTKEPIMIQGQQIGRLRASFLLLKETLRFLWLDKEMMVVPVITFALQIFLLGALYFSGLFSEFFAHLDDEKIPFTASEYIPLFLVYLISAFTIAYAQATISHIVYVRVHDGNATLKEGFRTANKYLFPLFAWSVIACTVGIILNAIAERFRLVGRILVALTGAVWSVLTYFVVPAVVIGNKPTFEAIRHSGSVFKHTWGETLVGNITLGFAFGILILVLVLILVGIVFVLGPSALVILVCGVIFFLALIVIIILETTLSAVLKTLLYVYATEEVVPTNFNRELLERMLIRKPLNPTVQGTNTV